MTKDHGNMKRKEMIKKMRGCFLQSKQYGHTLDQTMSSILELCEKDWLNSSLETESLRMKEILKRLSRMQWLIEIHDIQEEATSLIKKLKNE